MIYAAVFILSLSSLAFEVLLTRIFSITQWNHLSFMVISIALFGFASSGTFLHILGSRIKHWERLFSSHTAIILLLLAYSATAIFTLPLINRIPLDYFKITVEPVQLFYLLLFYLFLSLPFFFSGLMISVSYALIPESTGRIYFASMSGSAAGVLLPLFLLPLYGEARLTLFIALSPLTLIPLFFMYREKAEPPRPQTNRYALLLITSALILMAAWAPRVYLPDVFSVHPGPYKSLSSMLKFPGSRTEKTFHTLHGRVDYVFSPQIRHAPGLSLRYTEALPAQRAAYMDGDSAVVFYDTRGPRKMDFTRSTLPWAGYIAVPHPERVLVILKGGGTGVVCGLESGAKVVKVITAHPRIAELAGAHYTMDVTAKAERIFLEEERATFDIIHIDNPGASAPGVSALNQEHGFTREAFKAYLSHLSEKGAIIISRQLLLPPCDSLRLWATAYEALTSLGMASPENHLIMMRNWNRFTLVITRTPLKHRNQLETFASEMNFDIVFLSGLAPEKANRFNVFQEPYYFNEINRLFASYRNGTHHRFMEAYPVDISPQDDNRPFPSKHLKWSRIKELYTMMGKRPYSFLLSGEIVVPAVFVEALLISLLLIFLPFLAGLKQGGPMTARTIHYFFWTGAGFMFTEFYFIKKYIVVFGNPVISFAVVLFMILITSGVGGYLSRYVREHQIKWVLFILVLVLFLILPAGGPITRQMMKFSPFPRWIAGGLFILIPGILIGLPFTTGMHRFPHTPGQRAWAWAVSGSASVLASVLSAHIALNNGINAIMIWAALSYTLAWISILKPINLTRL